jgi:hypothetical protein
MTIDSPAPVLLNATQDPSANAGLILTPLTVTLRSLRGKLYFIAPSDWSVPDRPMALVTANQTSGPDLFWGLAVEVKTTTAANANAKHLDINPSRLNGNILPQ